MTAIQTYIDTYNRDGYVVVPDVFDPDRAAAALRDMESLFYGMSFEEYLAKSDKAGENAPLESAYGFQFPCAPHAFDRLQTDLHKSCGKQPDENPPILQV